MKKYIVPLLMVLSLFSYAQEKPSQNAFNDIVKAEKLANSSLQYNKTANVISDYNPEKTINLEPCTKTVQ